jgi:hypothetical protein
VWDGGAGDRNGQKSIATFIALGIGSQVASPTSPGDTDGPRDLSVLWAFAAVLLLLLIVSVGGLLRGWANRDPGAGG